MAALLPRSERLLLVERSANELALSPVEEQANQRADWMSLRGIAPNLLVEEDAQAWVSRTRQELDEQRKPQFQRKP